MRTCKTERKKIKKVAKSTPPYDGEKTADDIKVRLKRPPGRPRTHPGSIHTRWRSGISGNPAGRPKKPLSLTRALQNLMDEQLETTINGKEFKGTGAQVMARRLYDIALDTGDPQLIKAILDRIDGKIVDGKFNPDKPALPRIIEHVYKDAGTASHLPTPSAPAVHVEREQPSAENLEYSDNTRENILGENSEKQEDEDEEDGDEEIENNIGEEDDRELGELEYEKIGTVGDLAAPVRRKAKVY